jgi:hypothetical protein
MYGSGNPKTKAELKRWVADGQQVSAFLPNADVTGFATQTEGRAVIEGPHYPQPHRWYAQVELSGGMIVKVIK